MEIESPERLALSPGKLQSARRLLLILEAMAELNGEVGVSELGRKLGLSKSTVFRLLQLLVDYGYVQQNRTSGKYSLTLKLVSLGSQILDKWDMREVARPFMVELRDEFGETVNLVVRDGNQAVYVHVEGSKQQIGRYPHQPQTRFNPS